MPNQPTHGGQREGAGRPELSEDEPTIRTSVTVTQSLYDYLSHLGRNKNGTPNFSRGVRIAGEYHRNHGI